jgi:tetratricopeptide (TPR) repeat protein
MTSLKCRVGRVISRGFLAAAALALFQSRMAAAQAPILPPDAAVREYDLGLEALKKKDFRAAIERLNAALATGHVRPAERFGTSRYSVEWYDPYYWLGIAHMEMGDDDAARGFFARSREGGVIERRPEFADLQERTRLLDQREAARRPPTPVPLTPTVPPSPGGASVPDRAPRPESPATTTPARTEPATPRPDPVSVVPLIEAIAKGRFDDAEKALERVRARIPHAAEPELLAAVLYGSRFLLEGARDPSLLRSARLSLDTFRKRGGSRRAEEAWLSPSLRALLSE